MTRVAVVGHTEWVDFVRVPHHPERGDIVEGRSLVENAAGGAIVAACVIRKLGAEVDFYTALGDDDRAQRAHQQLSARGITVHAARRPGPTRYLFTTVEDGGERTIVTVGERYAPRLDDGLDLAPLRAADGVYVTAADPGLLVEAAGTGTLVVATRLGPAAPFAAVHPIRAAVFSASDPTETSDLDGWARLAEVLVATEGAAGGHWRQTGAGHAEERPPRQGRWPAAPLPGPARDSYGCGDAFAGGVTFGLATGGSIADAVRVGARCGAEQLTRVAGP